MQTWLAVVGVAVAEPALESAWTQTEIWSVCVVTGCSVATARRVQRTFVNVVSAQLAYNTTTDLRLRSLRGKGQWQQKVQQPANRPSLMISLLLTARSRIGKKGSGSFIQHQKCRISRLRSVSSRTGTAYSLGRSPSPRSRSLACSHTAARSPSLPFNVSQMAGSN